MFPSAKAGLSRLIPDWTQVKTVSSHCSAVRPSSLVLLFWSLILCQRLATLQLNSTVPGNPGNSGSSGGGGGTSLSSSGGDGDGAGDENPVGNLPCSRETLLGAHAVSVSGI